MEQVLWRLQQIGFNETKSMRRLNDMMHLPPVATLSSSSRTWTRRASVLIITSNVKPGNEEKIFQRGECEKDFGG